ncbi:MAG: STAS domain-containing protein [Enterovibrio sp.]
MRIDFVELEDLFILTVHGDMDAQGCYEVQSDIASFLQLSPLKNTYINLDNAHFCDGAGIGIIVYLFKKLKQDNWSLVLTGVHGQPLEIMKLLRIDTIMTIEQTAVT